MYRLVASPETILWGRLPDRKARPVLTVPSGSRIIVDTVSQEGLLEDQGRDPLAFFGAHGVAPEFVLPEAVAVAGSRLAHDFDDDGPHVILGPVRVEGAEPGDVLKVEMLALEPRVPYGVVANRHGKGALVGEFPEGSVRRPDADAAHPDRYGNVSTFVPIRKIAGRWHGVVRSGGREIRFPIRPFLGLVGVAPDSDSRRNSIPPCRVGGNIDVNELGAGSTLYLPVEVAGALFYTGDPHFAQGCGEVALTALEGSLRAVLRLTVLKKGGADTPAGFAAGLDAPFAETERHWVPMGIDPDLDEAMKSAVRAAIGFLSRQFGVERRLVYAYLSAATDFKVTQVVDRAKGVHALLAKSDFADFLEYRLEAGGARLPVAVTAGGLFADAAAVFDALGLCHSREGDTLRVESPAGIVRLTIDSARCRVGDDELPLPAAPIMLDGRAHIPTRSLIDPLGLELAWSTMGTTVLGRVEAPPPAVQDGAS